MAALYGDVCSIRLRRVPWLPVAYLDMRSQYAAAASLAGAWDLLRAERVSDQDADPAAFTELLRGLTVEQLLVSPVLWRRLGQTYCHVLADGDVLPHRVAAHNRWQSKLAPRIPQAAAVERRPHRRRPRRPPHRRAECRWLRPGAAS